MSLTRSTAHHKGAYDEETGQKQAHPGHKRPDLPGRPRNHILVEKEKGLDCPHVARVILDHKVPMLEAITERAFHEIVVPSVLA